MAKEDIINMEGRVEEVLPAAMFRIKLDNLPNLVVAHLSGRMRKLGYDGVVPIHNSKQCTS